MYTADRLVTVLDTGVDVALVNQVNDWHNHRSNQTAVASCSFSHTQRRPVFAHKPHSAVVSSQVAILYSWRNQNSLDLHQCGFHLQGAARLDVLCIVFINVNMDFVMSVHRYLCWRYTCETVVMARYLSETCLVLYTHTTLVCCSDGVDR